MSEEEAPVERVRDDQPRRHAGDRARLGRAFPKQPVDVGREESARDDRPRERGERDDPRRIEERDQVGADDEERAADAEDDQMRLFFRVGRDIPFDDVDAQRGRGRQREGTKRGAKTFYFCVG